MLLEAKEALLKAENKTWGNPNSVHKAGETARHLLEKSKHIIASCINCEPEQIIFTYGATEACQLAMQEIHETFKMLCSHRPSPFEHDAVRTLEREEAEDDIYVQSHILLNNETGAIYEDSVRKTKTVFTDATAAVGHIPVDFKNLKIGLLAAGAHKFGGPKGIGFLVSTHPEDIKGRFPHRTTPPVSQIYAMAKALEWRTEHMEENRNIVTTLHTRFLKGIKREIPSCKCISHLANEYQSPYIASVSFPGLIGQGIVLALSKRGIMASAGPACSNGSGEPSPVLLACGCTEKEALGAVRFSFDYTNTSEEIDRTIEALKEIISEIEGC